MQGEGLQAPLSAQQAAALLASVQQVLVEIQGLRSFTVVASQVRGRMQSILARTHRARSHALWACQHIDLPTALLTMRAVQNLTTAEPVPALMFTPRPGHRRPPAAAGRPLLLLGCHAGPGLHLARALCAQRPQRHLALPSAGLAPGTACALLPWLRGAC